MEEVGQALSRRQLVTSMIKKFGGDMIALSLPGIATILAFKATAAKMFHMIPDDTDDMCDVIEKVSKKVKTEINNIEIDKALFPTRLTPTIEAFQENVKRALYQCEEGSPRTPTSRSHSKWMV